MTTDRKKTLAGDLLRLRRQTIDLCNEPGASMKLTRAASRLQRSIDHLRYRLSQETADAIFWNVEIGSLESDIGS